MRTKKNNREKQKKLGEEKILMRKTRIIKRQKRKRNENGRVGKSINEDNNKKCKRKLRIGDENENVEEH